MLHIAKLLEPAELDAIIAILGEAEWVDGRETAGHLSVGAKRNAQLREGADDAERAGAIVSAALQRNALFMSAALPARIVPPLFNRYQPGDAYGPHIDGAVRHVRGRRIRTDLSATIFLTPPDAYAGGELAIAEGSFTRRVKLDAGDMLLYPARTVHEVEPVTRGVRTASFLWVQSIVADERQRQMLFELDQAIQALTSEHPDSGALLGLTGHYHNLIRLWADG